MREDHKLETLVDRTIKEKLIMLSLVSVRLCSHRDDGRVRACGVAELLLGGKEEGTNKCVFSLRGNSVLMSIIVAMIAFHAYGNCPQPLLHYNLYIHGRKLSSMSYGHAYEAFWYPSHLIYGLRSVAVTVRMSSIC